MSMSKAREIVASPSEENLAILVDKLFINRKNTNEYKAAKALYDFCVKTFQNAFTRMLLMVYRDSSDEVFRLRSIRLLSETLCELRDKCIELSPVALQEIKPIVISCLTKQEHMKRSHEAKILGTIVSFVAYNVMTLNNEGWDELSECILSLADTEPLKAFHVFLGLPPIKNREFLDRFMKRVMVEAEKKLLVDPEGENWRLGLETIVKLGIQVLNSEDRYDSVQCNILSILVKLASGLEKKGMKQILQRRLQGLEKFLTRDNNMYPYNEDQCRFVSELAGEMGKRSFKFRPSFVKTQENSSSSDRLGDKYLKSLSPLQILEMVASNKLEDSEQELAISQLNVLLSDHTNKKVLIDIDVIRKLQPLLISCLWKKEIHLKTFKILGQVVQHVAKEIFNVQEDTWVDLRDYITSHCQKTEFAKGCHVFRCLTMPLDAEDFVIPVMEKLLPQIRRLLNPPRQVLEDKLFWVLAFLGAFCAIIQMVEIESHAESVTEIEDKMIESVRHLVETRLETELVMRAFVNMKNVVKEQLEWYTWNEFTFVKRMLQRLLTIQGMVKDGKLLLVGINVMVETKMASPVESSLRRSLFC
ncbi:hypothetical protein EUTSA_v10017892mg [Eutrema salsugineum]|uniref:DUF577 domain-containing protein n=1 Tax=Eutrema salsugineum TaxID=72664 RepID=V4NYD2_EUTSA|nr:uncharacterized protein LOC18026520 [Eutrema salsugineum]ESQ51961.1 hypothetical protein EUTSA_v10017892mg [Eutrema salsugineum]